MSGKSELSKSLFLLVGGVAVLLFVVYLAFYRPAGKSEHSLPQVQEGGFESTVLKADKPVLVDFYADWCPPCRRMEPILIQFARENQNVKVVQVNIDDSRALADRYHISSIPHFMVFKTGDITAQHSGMLDSSGLKALINE